MMRKNNKVNKHWYQYGNSLFSFLKGDMLGNLEDIITWEGKNNVTYNNITKDLFDSIDVDDLLITGSPTDNWKNSRSVAYSDHFTALNGFCRKIEINATNLVPGMFAVSILSLREFQEERFKEF